MEASGPLHDPADLPKKNSKLSIEQKAVWTLLKRSASFHHQDLKPSTSLDQPVA
jgi:hypothetical protein